MGILFWIIAIPVGLVVGLLIIGKILQTIITNL